MLLEALIQQQADLITINKEKLKRYTASLEHTNVSIHNLWKMVKDHEDQIVLLEKQAAGIKQLIKTNENLLEHNEQTLTDLLQERAKNVEETI